MELSFWSWLCSDSSGVLLRQRIPEVALFYGCRLEAWYHNVSGVLVAERPAASITELLERFKDAAEAEGGGDGNGTGRPAAILRHESKGNPREGIPSGAVVSVALSLQQFTEILREVVEGRVVNLKTGALSELWTLQSYVEPRYGLRFLSAYTCDAHLEERHDVFAHPFQPCYPLLDGGPEERPPKSEPSVGQQRLEAAQREALESKTIGIVRFAHRFHKLDLEGLLLEFVVDGEGRLSLHGCWSASICNARDARRFRSAWPEKQGRVQDLPRAFSVPRLDESCEVDLGLGLGGGPGGQESAAQDPKRGACAGSGGRADGEPKATSTSLPSLLLEFWQGDTFLGEASLNREGSGSSCSQLRVLKLRPQGHEPALRADGRKLLADAAGGGTAVVSLTPGSAEDLLNFKMGRAEGLPVVDHEEKIHAVLWLPSLHRMRSGKTYAPVWSSSDCESVDEFVDGRWATVYVWNGESVDLSLPQQKVALQAATLAPEVPAPSPGASPRAFSRASPCSSARRQPATYDAGMDEVRSAGDHVCGAEFAAHWGMHEDGSLRGHLLASQVLQRMKLDRSNRSGLLKRLAQQVLGFHNMHRQWELFLETMKQKHTETLSELRNQETALQDRRDRRESAIAAHKQRMIAACRRMYTELDDYRAREGAEATALAQSRQRAQLQSARLADIAEKRSHFEESLGRIRAKVDDLLAEDVRLRQQLDETHAQYLASHNACLSVSRLSDDLADLAAVRSNLARTREAAQNEHKHILKMEDFVRRVAKSDAKTLRTGGGFILNSMAKAEAQSLVQELFLE